MFKVNKKIDVVVVFLLLTFNIFHTFSSVLLVFCSFFVAFYTFSIVDFEYQLAYQHFIFYILKTNYCICLLSLYQTKIYFSLFSDLRRKTFIIPSTSSMSQIMEHVEGEDEFGNQSRIIEGK